MMFSFRLVLHVKCDYQRTYVCYSVFWMSQCMRFWKSLTLLNTLSIRRSCVYHFFFQDAITYELVGSESSKLVFYVNPDSGLVSLKKSLSETVDEIFTVRHRTNFCVSLNCIMNVLKLPVLLILTRKVVTLEHLCRFVWWVWLI